MPGRKAFSQWDCLVLAERTVAARTVRFPPRLGRARPRFERWRRWNAADPGRGRLLGCAVGALFIGVMIVSMVIGPNAQGWIWLSVLVLFLVPFVLYIVFWSGSVDMRCVHVSHVRTRIVREIPTRGIVVVAGVVAERRLDWMSRVRNLEREVRDRMMVQSLAWRLTMCAYLVGFIAICMPLPIRDVLKSMGMDRHLVVPLGILGVVVLSKVTGVRVWSNIRQRLLGSAAGIECPDCGYHVGGGVPITVNEGVTVRLGPARCSECGCPWPLIPPPMAVEWRPGE